MFKSDVKEEWRPVVIYTDNGIFDYTGTYEVSNTLKVRRLPYTVISNGKTFNHTGGEIKGFIGKNGYYVYHLSIDNKMKNFYRSRMVASAFQDICGKWFKGSQIDHKDTNKLNDEPSNLRFVTCTENHLNPITVQHMVNSKTKQTGKRIIQKTLKDEFIKEYPSIRGACKENAEWRIGGIQWALKSKNHSAYGFKWEYV